MAKYHINPSTGRVNLCRVDPNKNGKCPHGSPQEHYTSKEAARAVYEKQNETFEQSPLKKTSKKTREEAELTARIDKWGPAAGGPNVNGLSPDEAYSARKQYAKSTIMHFGLSKDSSEDEIAKAAHSAGIPESFLKTRIEAEAHDASALQNKIAWEKKYGKSAGKTASPVAPGGNFAIDSQWRRIPGEGLSKTIRDSKGEPRGSIQLREGLYVLGARELKKHRRDNREITTGRPVSFEKNLFENEKEAVDYFNAWVKENPTVKLSD